MFAVFAIAIIILYVLLISRFIKGWEDTPALETDKMPAQIPVTIITAFKNEEANLRKLAEALDNQTYQNFEWILVDDHSTDKSVAVINEVIEQGFFGIKLLKNSGEGKKEALRTAMHEAKNEWVITLDADVLPTEDWLLNIVAHQEKYPSDLLICPVKIADSTSLLGQFQQFEFAALVASGAGAAKIGIPILCNGANLAFRKSQWLKNEQKLHFDEASGDDVYLLQSIKKSHGAVRFLKSKKAAVQTSAKDNLFAFLRQRHRWAGKKAMYRDKELLITALLIFLASVVMLTTAVLAVFRDYYPSLLLLLFLSKLAVDGVFFWKIKDFFGLKNVLLKSFLFSVVYPFYVVLATVGAVFSRNRW